MTSARAWSNSSTNKREETGGGEIRPERERERDGTDDRVVFCRDETKMEPVPRQAQEPPRLQEGFSMSVFAAAAVLNNML